MAKKTAIISCLFITLTFIFPAKSEELLLTTEDYAPFNYLEKGNLVGIGPDQITEIMKIAKIPYKMELMQWSRALGLAERQANTCVFTTDHTPERNSKFVWIEPLYVDRMILIKHSDGELRAENLTEILSIKVGAQTGDSTQEILQSNNFENIHTTRDLSQSVKKLIAGRIDAMAVSFDYFKLLTDQGKPVAQLITLKEIKSGIACHINTDPSITSKMQSALNEIIASGIQDKIISSHLN